MEEPNSMKISSLRLSLAILSLFLAGSLSGAEKVAFRNLTTDDGLISNQVTAVYRDSKGFLWIGTYEGLDRYDAYRFTHFSAADGMPGKYVSGITEDPDGRIWVHCREGAACYDYADNRFSPAKEALAGYKIRIDRPGGFGASPDHRFFWAQEGDHVAVYDKRRRSTMDFSTNGDNITKISLQNDRMYIMCSDGRLFRANLLTGIREEVGYPAPLREKVAAGQPQVFADSRNGLWIYTFRSSVVLHYTPLGGWREETLPVDYEQFNRMTGMAEDSSGNVWAITSHHGIFIFQSDGGIRQLTHDRAKLFSIPGDNLVAIHIDRDDIVWIGNFKLGLSCHSPRSHPLLHYDVPGTNDILSVCETPEYVFLGTDGSGLLRASGYDMPFEAIDIGANVIDCLARDGKGDLWAGTWENGLIRLGPDGKAKQVFNSRNSGLLSNSVFSILSTGEDCLYLCQFFGAIQQMTPSTGEIKTLFRGNVRINDMILARDSVLVAATTEGLLSVHARTGESRFLLSNHRKDFPLTGYTFDALFKDSRGILWMGGRQGILWWNLLTDDAGRITMEDGIASDSAASFAEDPGGLLWIGTARGLSSVNMDGPEPVIRNYTLKDGLGWGDFNQRAMLTLVDGDILAGTPDGFTVIPSTSSRSGAYEAAPFLTGIEMKHTDRTFSFDARELSLREGQLPLLLHFSTLDFDRQNTVSYDYMIKGHTGQWRPMRGNVVEFSVLPPGKYDISVRVGDAERVWSPNVKTITVTVRPPWYKSTVAWIAYALAVVTGLALLLNEARKRRERKKEVERISREMEEQQRLVDMKLTFFANVSHELRTPLSLIINPLEEFIARYPQYGTGFLSTVRNNATYLKELIDQLLSFRKMDAGGETMHYVHQNIVSGLQDVFLVYQSLAEKRHIRYKFLSEPSVIEMDFDRDKVTKILHNLLSNAFHFTPDGGRIDVTVRKEGDHLSLQVADDGSGIPEADRKRIFEMFYQVADDSRQTGGSGIGLYLVSQYVQMHHGDIHVDDNQPKGSVFTVRIPLAASIQLLPQTARPKPSGTDIPVQFATNHAFDYTVLLVDDNIEFLDFLCDSLSTEFRVFKALEGSAALKILQEEEIDLVVSDVMMPQMSGLELCRRIKSDPRTSSVPVLLLTAKTGEEFHLEGLNQGADDYITKPFNLDILKMRIRKFIEEQPARPREDGKMDIDASRVSITPLDRQFIDKAVKYVEDHLADPDFSVNDLADGLFISRGYLYRRISKITGKSAIEFIRIIRMKQAQQLLAESQLQVAEVAYKVGYNSPKTFAKHFREVFGTSPSEYIRSWKKDGRP